MVAIDSPTKEAPGDGVEVVSTTAWFMALDLKKRKTLLSALHEFRIKLEESHRMELADFIMELARRMDADHQLIKSVESVHEL